MKNVITPKSRVENFLRKPVASSISAMLGWSIESELVTAARNSRTVFNGVSTLTKGSALHHDCVKHDVFIWFDCPDGIIEFNFAVF